jgi:hypothetical protein
LHFPCNTRAALAYSVLKILTRCSILSADLTSIRSAETISLLVMSVLLLLAFPVWMHYSERSGKPALVPNKLWKNLPFASTCIMVTLSSGVMNSIELFSSL